jgi:hypothetical protein
VIHAGSGQDPWVHQARVDAHHLHPGIRGDPVRDAPALPTAVGREDPVAPHVDVGGLVSYVHRDKAQKPSGDVEDSTWPYSLMNWGHDPLK